MSKRTIHTIYGKRIPWCEPSFVKTLTVQNEIDWVLREVSLSQLKHLDSPVSEKVIPLLNIDELMDGKIDLCAQGYTRLILSIDEDCRAISRLSPRFSEREKIEQTIGQISDVIRLYARQTQCLVALTVEELCPGGLDPSDGIALSRQFVKSGAVGIIASGGTQDFLPLKLRRATKLKTKECAWPETWLSSALWLVGKVDVPVYAQGIVTHKTQTLKDAARCGLAGVIDISVKYPSAPLTMS